MKTQRTKLVARIAMALLAGMMVLALASCGSKNPLKGHTYEYTSDKETFTITFTGNECTVVSSKKGTKNYFYKLDSEHLLWYFDTDRKMVQKLLGSFYNYKEDGSAVKYGEWAEKVK